LKKFTSEKIEKKSFPEIFFRKKSGLCPTANFFLAKLIGTDDNRRMPWWRGLVQGCQMVSFQTKNPNLGKFCMALDSKILIYFIAI
jgi:hypothetical protein